MKSFVKKAYIYLLLLFLYAPIIVLVIYSFNDSKYRSRWGGFSLRWYKELFTDARIMNALYYTITIALIAAIVATLLGTMASIGIFSMGKRSKKIIKNISYIPILNPDIVTGISLMMLFLFINIRLGFSTMLMAHITFCTPYVILSVLPKLQQLDSSLYEAALDLGAKPWQAISKVIVPEIKPGIITGFLLAFTLSVDDFVISFFTTGSGVTNLSIQIFSMAKKGINPKINAISTLMLLTVMILLIIIQKRQNKTLKYKEVSNEEK